MQAEEMQYRQEGERLIRKLSVYQFGCLGVYAGEWPRGDPDDP